MADANSVTAALATLGASGWVPTNDSRYGGAAALTNAEVAAARTRGVSVALMEARGDSLTAGFGLTNVADVYGQQFANKYCQTKSFKNGGINGAGVFTNFNYMVGNVSGLRPTTSGSPLTVWIAGYNDMRSGNTQPRLNTFRGSFTAGLLLMCSNWAALRQFYNGGGGGTFFGAPAGSLALGGSWGVTAIGETGTFRGINASTNANTATYLVNGNVVYVVFDKNKVNTGGTFSVTIDGTVVAASVSCDGTGLLGETTVDEPVMSGATVGYPTVLRFPTTPGKHTVVITITSATAGANFVQLHFVAGNSDMQVGQPRTVIVAGVPRMNAAGYAGSSAAYASLAIGDAAVYAYQNVQREVINELAADGFDVRYADPNGLFDATVAANIQADNIHFTTAGHLIWAGICESAWINGSRIGQMYGGGIPARTITAPASATFVQNLEPYPIDVMITGGTVSACDFSRDGSTAINVGGASPQTIRVAPLDWWRITYTVAPTVTLVSR